MKYNFEKREKIIISGLLIMLNNAAKEAKQKTEAKYTKRLVNKFQGEGEVNLKPEEVKVINMMLNTIIEDSKLELADGELPKMNQEDLDTCKTIKTKIG